METGSLADWASAAGSFLAVITALYLSGSERRAARAAQRPELTIESVTNPDADGWGAIRLVAVNHSTKDWAVNAVTVLRPHGGLIVNQTDCFDRTKHWDSKFDPSIRDSKSSRHIPTKIRLRPSGVTHGGQIADRSYQTFLFKVAVKARLVRLRLDFESLEPSPDRFSVFIARAIDGQ